VPVFSVYLSVKQTLGDTVKEISFEAYHKLMFLRHPTIKGAVTCWSQFDELMRFVTSMEHDSKNIEKYKFLMRQVHLLNAPKNTTLYSMDDFCQAFSWFARSRSLYEDLRKSLLLPSVSTLQKLTRMAKNLDDETMYTSFFQKQEERCKACILIVDEIYVKASMTYRGGILFGDSIDQPGKIASTLLCIMVKCLFGGEKFLVKLLPCHGLTAAFQFSCITDVITMLEKCGGQVLAVICDNNRTNQACYKSFTPVSENTPWIVDLPSPSSFPSLHHLFLIYDPVHLLKNIRNNWLTDKLKKLKFPTESDSGEYKVATWSDLCDLYNHESTTMVKLSKLTKSTVSPSNIEKQRVSLVINVFCDQTSTALKTSEKSCSSWVDTSHFLDLTIKMWKILNCKSIRHAARLRDPFRQVIDNSPAGQDAKQFLLQWAERARQMAPKKVREQSLTKDTSAALAWTLKCLVDLSTFLLETNMACKHEYVPLGFFQQDDLERHFGHFRMSAGCNFYLTVEDVYSAHNIDRCQFMLSNHPELDYKLHE